MRRVCNTYDSVGANLIGYREAVKEFSVTYLPAETLGNDHPFYKVSRQSMVQLEKELGYMKKLRRKNTNNSFAFELFLSKKLIKNLPDTRCIVGT